jgi:hypothetical protein
MFTYMYGKEAVTVVVDGKPHVVRKGERMNTILAGLKSGDWDLVRDTICVTAGLSRHFQKYGDVEIIGDRILLNGKQVHGYLVRRIIEARDRGEIMVPLLRFLANVEQNPDPRARSDLFEWVEHAGYSLTADGCIIAVRAIRADWYDVHTGTMLNALGAVVKIPREECDPNPDQTCSRGLHFCTMSYLPHFSRGGRHIIVRIHPKDVVAFPRDYGWSKGRCCEFTVLEELPEQEAEKYLKAGFTYRPPSPEAYARSLGFRLVQDTNGGWGWLHDTMAGVRPAFETEAAAAADAVETWQGFNRPEPEECDDEIEDRYYDEEPEPEEYDDEIEDPQPEPLNDEAEAWLRIAGVDRD